MRILDLRSDDPAVCLATEEYLLMNGPDEDIFMLWSGRPSVICGKFQNPFEEVSLTECRKRGVEIFRRCSGGGAVYHDRGNINYTIISSRDDETGYGRFLAYAAGFLNSLGAGAYPEGNMIKIGDFKVSGNAQANSQTRVLHHGTLLFECDLDTLSELTQGSRAKFTSKAIKSNPHPVTNIRPHLTKDLSAEEFRSLFIDYMKGADTELILDGTDMVQIGELAETKYRTWEWNFGRTPDFSLSAGPLKAQTHRGRFTSFSVGNRACPGMTGTRLIPEESEEILKDMFPSTYKDILNAIYN